MARSKRYYDQDELAVKSIREACEIVSGWLDEQGLGELNRRFQKETDIDKRHWTWRVSLVDQGSRTTLGEIVVDALGSTVLAGRSTTIAMLRRRIAAQHGLSVEPVTGGEARSETIGQAGLLIEGDCEFALQSVPAASIGLVFTSPPYFNAKPEYSEYIDYQDYLEKLRRVFRACHQALAEGRFIAVNTSPVIVRRTSRSEQSRRLAVPFDLHRILTEEGFDFMEDIVWEKPEGAGWASGRGRQFATSRTPLAYKCAPITEYILVYRKHTDRLLDWNIRSQDPDILKASRVEGGYERTNVWRIKPAHDSRHPAIFPLELAEKIIRYYSFVGDTVLDPFAGLGTTGQAAASLGRKFVLIEQDPRYADVIRAEGIRW